jgi:hypothetical protein
MATSAVSQDRPTRQRREEGERATRVSLSVYDDTMPSRAACVVGLSAALLACGAPPATSNACLTRADCASSEICIAGRCVTTDTDGGSARDSGPMSSDGAADDTGTDVDAFVADDAGARDAMPGIDAPTLPDAHVPVHGDSCADPITLTLDGSGHAHAEGDFTDFVSDHRTYCGGDFAAADAVFFLDLTGGPEDVEINVAGSDGTDTTVAMSETCAGEGEFYSCHDDRAPSDPRPRMILHRFPSPRLYVLVRAFSTSDTGHFTLDIDVTPVADTSSCTTPIDLTGGAYVAAWSALTDLAPNPSCLPDLPYASDVYRVLSRGEMTVQSIDGYFGDTQGAISMIDSCAAPTTESWCALSSWTSDSYYGVGGSMLPFQATPLGYVVVTQPRGSYSYSFSFYP